MYLFLDHHVMHAIHNAMSNVLGNLGTNREAEAAYHVHQELVVCDRLFGR